MLRNLFGNGQKICFDRIMLPVQITLKLGIYCVYAFAMYGIVKLLLNVTLPYNLMILYIAGIVIFGAYDYLLLYAGEYFRIFVNKNRS